MVSINYEIGEKPVAIEPFRLPRDRDSARGNFPHNDTHG